MYACIYFKKNCWFFVRNNAIEQTNDNIEVYQYGVEVGLSSLCNLLVIFVIGIVFRSLLASITFLLVFLLIRRHTGGYHADSYLKCNVIFGTVFLLILVFGKIVDAFDLTIVLRTFTFLTLLGGGMSVNASKDTTMVSNVSVNPNSSGVWTYSPNRLKETDSKAYIYITSGNVAPNIRISGRSSSSGSGGTNCTLDNNGNSVSSVSCSVGSSMYINNDVRKHGSALTCYNYANIGVISPFSSSGGGISYSWAPDSTYSAG